MSLWFVRNVVSTLVLTATCASAGAEPLRVYAIRGFAGAVFSQGMSKLCEALTSIPQITCTVEDFYDASALEKQASVAMAAGQRLVLVGHSLGANAALRIAGSMKGDIPLVVTIDPNWFWPPTVPGNVEVVLNYYQTSGVVGHAVLQAPPAFRGKLEQILRSELHHRIDASAEVHAQIAARVRTIMATANPPLPQPKPPFSEGPGTRPERVSE